MIRSTRFFFDTEHTRTVDGFAGEFLSNDSTLLIFGEMLATTGEFET